MIDHGTRYLIATGSLIAPQRWNGLFIGVHALLLRW